MKMTNAKVELVGMWIPIWKKGFVANLVLISWQPPMNLIMRTTTTLTGSLSALEKLLLGPTAFTTTMIFVLMGPVSIMNV